MDKSRELLGQKEIIRSAIYNFIVDLDNGKIQINNISDLKMLLEIKKMIEKL